MMQSFQIEADSLWNLAEHIDFYSAENSEETGWWL